MTEPGLEIRLLGPVNVLRSGVAVALPRSRKVRALLAYLALAPVPQSRSRLCDLLWSVPNDPRGELRWCLSKLRGVLDDDAKKRVVTSGPDLIALDLSDCRVDALEIDRVVRAGLEGVPGETLEHACTWFGGDLLDGTQIDGSPELTGWLAAQRQRFRGNHIAVVRELATRAARGSDGGFRWLDTWLQLAPFDLRAHEVMLDALVASGRIGDAEQHVAAAIRSFEHEGVDWAPLRERWTAIRGRATRVEANAAPSVPAGPPVAVGPRRRASVAVMRFGEQGIGDVQHGRIGDGITEDIITRLAKLRVLFVIARGSIYALAERGIDSQEAARILDVEYVVSGTVKRHGQRITVVVELADTEHGRIVWTDELHAVADDAFSMLDAIVDRIVAAIADEIETAERQRAILKPPSSLDAWEAYHRGLWHMYRFTGPDNREAAELFRTALALDPMFSRAFAGLSFTHFQNAFLALTPDREHQIDLALDTAGRSLGADERDPAAHWAMGRALWLRGEQRGSIEELERAIELSPNFALGHYMLGFVHSQSGDPRAAIAAANHSRELSPFDPLQFGMLGARALAHLRLGELEDAVDSAIRAAARPNAHVHILAIAALSLAVAERLADAAAFVARIRGRTPGYSVEAFLRSFRFDGEAEAMFRSAATRIGFTR